MLTTIRPLQSRRTTLAQTDVFCLALLSQRIERRDRVFQRRSRVDAMQIVQIGREAQSLDRTLYVCLDVFWRIIHTGFAVEAFYAAF
jgi:hypothetical protein